MESQHVSAHGDPQESWTACSHFGRGPLGLEFYDTVEILLKRDHN